MRGITLCIILGFLLPVQPASGAEPPNILLLFIDTLRADHMSLYGYERATTPNIDAFAAGATTFARAYSPSSWTRASFASYFTGLYPSVHGCEDEQGKLDPSLQTLAERLRERGYATAGFFANYNISASWGFAQGFDIYEHPPANAGYPGDYQLADAAQINRRVFHWLQHESSDQPWFLFVLYIDPHDPYLPHADHSYGTPPAPEVNGSRPYLEAIKDRKPDPDLVRIQEYIRGLYDGEIAYVDTHVGRLLELLDREGLAEDTVVIISADHGEGLWDHRQYRGHGKQVFEEQILVPLIVRWPGRSSPGSRVREPVPVFSFFGALAEAYGLAAVDEHQAGSLLPLLAGDQYEAPILIEENLKNAPFRALIDWPWKLIHNDGSRQKDLYQLEQDPYEMRSLRYLDRKRVARMVAALDSISHLNSFLQPRFSGTDSVPELSEEEQRELRALGYID